MEIAGQDVKQQGGRMTRVKPRLSVNAAGSKRGNSTEDLLGGYNQEWTSIDWYDDCYDNDNRGDEWVKKNSFLSI